MGARHSSSKLISLIFVPLVLASSAPRGCSRETRFEGALDVNSPEYLVDYIPQSDDSDYERARLRWRSLKYQSAEPRREDFLPPLVGPMNVKLKVTQLLPEDKTQYQASLNADHVLQLNIRNPEIRFSISIRFYLSNTRLEIPSGADYAVITADGYDFKERFDSVHYVGILSLDLKEIKAWAVYAAKPNQDHIQLLASANEVPREQLSQFVSDTESRLAVMRGRQGLPLAVR